VRRTIGESHAVGLNSHEFHRQQHPPPVLFRPRHELLTVPVPVDDDHWRRRPVSPVEVLEAVATDRPLARAIRGAARPRRDALAVFIEPDRCQVSSLGKNLPHLATTR